MEGTISVDGSGSIHVVPDVTRLEVSVESVFPTYEDAYKQAKENASWMGQILEYNHLSAKLAKSMTATSKPGNKRSSTTMTRWGWTPIPNSNGNSRNIMATPISSTPYSTIPPKPRNSRLP